MPSLTTRVACRQRVQMNGLKISLCKQTLQISQNEPRANNISSPTYPHTHTHTHVSRPARTERSSHVDHGSFRPLRDAKQCRHAIRSGLPPIDPGMCCWQDNSPRRRGRCRICRARPADGVRGWWSCGLGVPQRRRLIAYWLSNPTSTIAVVTGPHTSRACASECSPRCASPVNYSMPDADGASRWLRLLALVEYSRHREAVNERTSFLWIEFGQRCQFSPSLVRPGGLQSVYTRLDLASMHADVWKTLDSPFLTLFFNFSALVSRNMTCLVDHGKRKWNEHQSIAEHQQNSTYVRDKKTTHDDCVVHLIVSSFLQFWHQLRSISAYHIW